MQDPPPGTGVSFEISSLFAFFCELANGAAASIMGNTVSDLRSLPAYPGLRRRCLTRVGPRVRRETSAPPVLGKETTGRAADSARPLRTLPTNVSRNSFEL